MQFLKVFIPIFVVVDPFGALVIYISLTSGMNTSERLTVTKDAVIYGFLILLLFALLGGTMLYFFGISIEALEIAGGIILLVMGISMVREGDRPRAAGGNVEKDVGIVPLATPLLAGPGAISLVIILMNGGILQGIFAIVSLLFVFGMIYVFFRRSSSIFRMLGERNLKALTRILGLLVAGFAVQYIIDAVTAIVHGF